MSVSVTKDGRPNWQATSEALVERSGRIALILSFSVLGLATAYFGALYLIAH
jgi:hypothetical protein